MKILQIASSMPDDWGGIERFVTYACSAMMDRGHSVTLACPQGSPISQHAKAPQVDILLRRKYDLKAFASYRNFFRAAKFDVIVTHFSPDYLMPILAARGKSGSAILTRHLAVPWAKARTKQYLKLYQRFLGVSDAVTNVLVETGIPRQRAATCHLGIPDLQDRVKVSQPLEFQVGMFGRLVAEKGHSVAIEACRSANVPLNVYGDGPLREKLQAEADHLIKFHGYLEDPLAVMAEQSAIVIPSIWAEAFTVNALEALCLGKPIVAANVGGVPEAIIDNESGLLFSKGSATEMAQCLTRLKEEAGLADNLGSAARERYLKLFTLKAFGERLESAYRDAM